MYSTSCLVSVYGTSRFWSRFKFYPTATDEVLQGKIDHYGQDAAFLERNDSK
jgi:hypothetical protein